MKKDSKNISKVIIEKNQKYLVFVRADNGKFDLPGGHCHEGESFERGAIRETYEESNLEIRSLELKVLYDTKRIFYSDDFSGKIKLDKSENSTFIWMNIEEITDLSVIQCTDALAIAAGYLNRIK